MHTIIVFYSKGAMLDERNTTPLEALRDNHFATITILKMLRRYHFATITILKTLSSWGGL
jgi:hypothetical protein